MLATTDKSLTVVAEEWLARFERALGEARSGLRDLFHPDSHWRDVLALTWHIRTVDGVDAVAGELAAQAARAQAAGFRIDPARTAPRKVTRAGTEAIEAIFRFETAEGRGSGVLRLTPGARRDIRRPGRCSPRSTSSKATRRRSAGRGRTARPIRAISAARTGSICGNRLRPMRTAIRRCWWSAAARPGSRSRRASRS